MIRQILTPTEPTVTVYLPDAMVGKTIELIAFEIEANGTEENIESKAERLKKIELLTASSLVDLTGFQFDRSEANNYDE